MAFIPMDFELFMDGEIPIVDVISCPTSVIACACIRWHIQKNKQNGGKIPFSHDTASLRLCPVVATLQIVSQAAALGQNSSCPLGIKVSTSLTNPFQYITTANKCSFALLHSQPTTCIPSTPILKLGPPTPFTSLLQATSQLHCTNFSTPSSKIGYTYKAPPSSCTFGTLSTLCGPTPQPSLLTSTAIPKRAPHPLTN